jgi:hypothetical protein
MLCYRRFSCLLLFHNLEIGSNSNLISLRYVVSCVDLHVSLSARLVIFIYLIGWRIYLQALFVYIMSSCTILFVSVISQGKIRCILFGPLLLLRWSHDEIPLSGTFNFFE